MRSALLLLPFLAACAGMPPRVTDRSNPRSAYETFRGALARGELEREYACLSPGLLARLGVASRAQWADLRVVALPDSHIVVRGIRRSRVACVPSQRDDLAEADLKFPFGIKGKVRLVRYTTLRIFVEGENRARVYEILPERARVEASPAGLQVILPGEAAENMGEALRGAGPVARIELQPEWFLDDFDIAGTTPAQVARVSAGRETHP